MAADCWRKGFTTEQFYPCCLTTFPLAEEVSPAQSLKVTWKGYKHFRPLSVRKPGDEGKYHTTLEDHCVEEMKIAAPMTLCESELASKALTDCCGN